MLLILHSRRSVYRRKFQIVSNGPVQECAGGSSEEIMYSMWSYSYFSDRCSSTCQVAY